MPGSVPMGSVATPNNTIEWRQSLKLSDGDIEMMNTWDVNQTVNWLKSMGLSVFAQQFQDHQISGDVLPLLTLQELKDMGINFVGPRTHLLKHINKLKRQYKNLQRNKILWEGKEERYANPCEMAFDYFVSCCMPDPADKYQLTNSSIKLTEKVFPYGKLCRCICKGSKINTIDLSMVKDVDATSTQTCCYGRDELHVDAEGEDGTNIMFLPLGTAPNAIKMIRDAVEGSQERQKVSGLI